MALFHVLAAQSADIGGQTEEIVAYSAAFGLPLGRVRGANDDIRVAMVGLGSHVKIGGKGRKDINTFRNMPRVRIVALCDADTAILAPEVDKFKKRNKPVKAYTDVRKCLEDADIDVVVNSRGGIPGAIMPVY